MADEKPITPAKSSEPWTQEQRIASFRETREEALEYFPKYLTDALLAMPEKARAEMVDMIDGTLFCLTEWADHDYCIPIKPDDTLEFSRDDVESIRHEWRCIASLLEDEHWYAGKWPDTDAMREEAAADRGRAKP
jgi:hypothetical protein